jgi:ankyrin repeat protein
MTLIELNKKQGEACDWINKAQLLHLAIKKNRMEEVKNLVDKGANIEEVNKEGYRPLHLAISLKRYEIIEHLLKNLADPNVYHPHGLAPIHTATSLKDKKSLNLLFLAGANPHAKVRSILHNGWTCIHSAARDGDIGLAKMLLYYGADINSATPSGETPLFLSTHAKKIKMLTFLINNGANICHKDIKGKNVGDIAKQYGLELTLNKLIAKKFIKSLPMENSIEI